MTSPGSEKPLPSSPLQKATCCQTAVPLTHATRSPQLQPPAAAAAASPSAAAAAAAAAGSSPSAPAPAPQHDPAGARSSSAHHDAAIAMENAPRDESVKPGDPVDVKTATDAPNPDLNVVDGAEGAEKPVKSVKKKKTKKDKGGKKQQARKRGKKSKRGRRDDSSDSDDSASDSETSDEAKSDESSSDEGEDSSSSEDEGRKRSRKKSIKVRKTKAKKSKKKGKKSRKYDSSSSESDSESDKSESSSSSDSESSEEESKRHARRRKSKRKSQRSRHADESDDDDVSEADGDETNLTQLLLDVLTRRTNNSSTQGGGGEVDEVSLEGKLASKLTKLAIRGRKKPKDKRKGKKQQTKRGTTLEFKRVDELWDNTIHNYKLTESAEDPVDEFNSYVFTVRRRFDWENKYRSTVVDIKSKLLREALADIFKDVKGVSLVEDQPSIDPNMLFLYLEELRTYAKKTLKNKAKKEKKRKQKKKLRVMASHCKIMIKYLDEDYDETKKTLYPMLEAGNITFDLLWALFKPNTLAYTTTYGAAEHPRCFKVDYAYKERSFIRGEWYCIEGRYLEYDGKNYGLGDFEINVDSFKGPRKITSLATYPIRYHKDVDNLKKQLVERGKRFVTMTGMNYRFHKGLAFEKRKKAVAKHNVNGRVMIDPAIFRRINPNYPISLIKPKDQDALYDMCCSSDDDDDDDSDCEMHGPENNPDNEEKEHFKLKLVYDENKMAHLVKVQVDEDGVEIKKEKLDKLAGDADANGENAAAATDDDDRTKNQVFSEEELLIASPVVLGFSFADKRWLEFSIAGIREIEWNEGAFDSLVLPPNDKSIVKALVSSHKFHAAETIDDVVQGKGKGLVFVLHGSPGVGKTLTAEGIADFLKCPLYAVSAGELGTDSWRLEQELQKIMDIAHSWGAILLLDEADVFLEKRQVHDIHRNALVSIFLRLLEYFQGILFLTTNRVETFDDAFQSRTHMGLRYEDLGHHAKREIWKMFLKKVEEMDGMEMDEFEADDYNALARKDMNGRQIKNAVRTAQALAVNEQSKLSMSHIRRVLDVAASFERDLKGGTGYLDAMRSYT
ncbi:putative AAA family ATPase [Phyllosticta citricarpa]|uniref:AAA family ATPase n=1 Tax=Phyllosticta citricarpa TaxID=55181 RepID=A0ABR1MKA7_9PEZI